MIGKRRISLAAVITGVTLVPLAAFGGVGLAHALPSASQYQYGPSGNQYGKMTICHHMHSKKNPGVTISISTNAWKAHQRHGDTPGACTGAFVRPATSAPATTGTTTTTEHGKSGEQH